MQFNDNQIRLGAGTEVSSILIASLDDVGFANNQSIVMPAAAVEVNGFVVGTSVRGTDSQFCRGARASECLPVHVDRRDERDD